MLWYKQSCNIHKNAQLRKACKSTTEYWASIGFITILKSIVGDSLTVEKVKGLKQQPITKLSMDMELFFAFMKTDNGKLVREYIERINQSGIEHIDFKEEEGLMSLEIPEIKNELDNYLQPIHNKGQSLPHKDENIITTYANDSQGVQMKSVYKTLNQDTGEERYFVSGEEMTKDRYDEFLEKYCD